MISIRKLDQQELHRIKEIDRSEEISELYQYRQNQLKLVAHIETVPGFEEMELEVMIIRQFKLIAAGGLVFGAFDGKKLVAVASVEHKKRGSLKNYCKMDILYVSSLYKGRGIAKQLVDCCKIAAKDFGANKLYISATPTKNTVDFYLKRGAAPVIGLDSELFNAEPEDIHLELDVNR